MYKTLFFAAAFLLLSKTGIAQTVASVDSAIANSNDLIKNGSNVIFTKVDVEAEFPGGISGWQVYLEKNLNANVPIEKGAPAGKYTVIIAFIVSKDGTISDIKAETHFGYGMEEEVVRVIQKGPQWVPAMQSGRRVNAYRRQPVTFVISNQ